MNKYNEYEIIFILHPHTLSDLLKKHVSYLQKMIEENSGKTLKLHIISPKSLEWVRKKQNTGIYIYHRYIVSSNIINKYEQYLSNLDNLMLKQFILLNKNVDLSSYKSINSKENLLTITSDNNIFMKNIFQLNNIL